MCPQPKKAAKPHTGNNMSSTNTDIESSADAAATSASASGGAGGAGGGAGATMTNSRAATASASSSSTKIDRSTYMQRYAVADAPSTVDVFMFHSRSADKAPGNHNPITSSSQTPYCSDTHCVSACLTPPRLSQAKASVSSWAQGIRTPN